MRCHFELLMKILALSMIPAALALVACESFNTPLNSNGGFDPLRAPGSGMNNADSSYGPAIYPGQFVTANIPNTAFYKNKPKGSEDADKLLSMGTNMKIVSDDGAYVKVELDSGEVGWVPSVMVTSTSANIAPVDGAYQIYPPLPDTGGVEPLPLLDENGQPPGGSIPTIIDPNAPTPPPTAPLTVDPVPDLTPSAPGSVPDTAPEAAPEVPKDKPAENVEEKVEEKIEEEKPAE
jgi:hypothetical protein